MKKKESLKQPNFTSQGTKKKKKEQMKPQLMKKGSNKAKRGNKWYKEYNDSKKISMKLWADSLKIKRDKADWVAVS